MDPAPIYENNFNTTPLRSSQSYRHYEKLGVGNSTVVEFERLNFLHNRVYYINMHLRNRLGYTNVVSSPGFLVDLTPPTPGKIRNSASDSLQRDGCSASRDLPNLECIDSSEEPNHRYDIFIAVYVHIIFQQISIAMEWTKAHIKNGRLE